MERKYFYINEDLAYYAKQQWSFTEYKKGTWTEEYKEACNNVYDLAEKVQQEKQQYFEEAYNIALKYASKYANWINEKHKIDMICPSVMICGGANFPTKKKERQNSRMDSHWKELEYIKQLPQKIEKILKGDIVIKSWDSDAIEKLKEKLSELETLHAGMKEANKYYKKNNTLEGFTGLPEEVLNKTIQLMSYSWYGNKPFDLVNNNAKIKNTKARIAELEKVKEEGTKEVVIAEPEEGNELFKVVENTELMRLQLLFDGKPSDSVRDLVKKNGFKWSPKNGAWQRQLTDNARYSLKRIKPELEKLLSA